MQINTLLPELRKMVVELAEDLLERATGDAATDAGLRVEFAKFAEEGRTAQAFEMWRDDYLDQVAVAWVLACVFVRFMEDNELIDECWLAGEGERRLRAEESHELFVSQHPLETDREYFHHVFHAVGDIPAARDLFAEGKTPLWAVGISGDAAMQLREFWRKIDPATGQLLRPFRVENGDTRFLGDLYQDLSEKARKKYALLQTPEFVEEFILDRTLTPALDEFGLEKVRMIDPTCGSGHFLLGAFARLFREWSKPQHSTGNVRNDVQKALDGVWGVDINPFAVAIARFRLIVAATKVSGEKRFRKNGDGWNVHLAAGDSLLFGKRMAFDSRVRIDQSNDLFVPDSIYAVEEADAVSQILDQGYHVVVGNPPYITVKDSLQNETYRRLYSSCHRAYSLSVPFAQRFWELAMKPGASELGGFVGQITANSFMKREFGKKLIEDFFSEVELTHVIDTSGAYVPGHGTPTVILFGRGQKPVQNHVRAVFGLEGEPAIPAVPAEGHVWSSIKTSTDCPGFVNQYISVSDVERSVFCKHPWSLGGGAAGELKSFVESVCDRRLDDCILDIGRSTHTGEDEAFYLEIFSCKTRSMIDSTVPLVEGDGIRNFSVDHNLLSIFPYSQSDGAQAAVMCEGTRKHLWRLRELLRNRVDFGRKIEDRGLRWFDHSMFFPKRFLSRQSIVYAEIATHNHFAVQFKGKLFKHSAGVIVLGEQCGHMDYCQLLGYLSSSIACYYLKQICFEKGGGGEAWEWRFVFNSMNLRRLPVPRLLPEKLGSRLCDLALKLAELSPSLCVSTYSAFEMPSKLLVFRQEYDRVLGELIYLQEEIDWFCYGACGVVSEDLTDCFSDVSGLSLGCRAFEILLAKKIQNSEVKSDWFAHHGSSRTVEVPGFWPSRYGELVRRRIDVIESNLFVNQLERPEYKRRWNTEPWPEQQQRALKNWLLDRLENPAYQKGTKEHPEFTTSSQMADVASADASFLEVAELYRGRAGFDVAALVAELVEGDAVPFLPALRYKPAGLRKREVWERTWDLQRQEDAGKAVGTIPVPPKYTSADFLKGDYWRLRGKLDVPKERWISYPHCSADNDPSLVVVWAGLNHLEQARALVSYYDARKRDGWTPEHLKPLLAGLDQLIPWIRQWHPEIDPNFGEAPGDSFQTLLVQDAHELGLTLEEIRAWEPPAKVRKTKATKKKKAAEDEGE